MTTLFQGGDEGHRARQQTAKGMPERAGGV